MRKGKYQCHTRASCTYHLPSTCYLSRATQVYLIMKNVGEFSGKKFGAGTNSRKVTSQREKTAEENKKGDRKGELNESPEIPDRCKTQTAPESLWGLCVNNRTTGEVCTCSQLAWYCSMGVLDMFFCCSSTVAISFLSNTQHHTLVSLTGSHINTALMLFQSNRFPCQRMHLWWSLCILYLLACQWVM